MIPIITGFLGILTTAKIGELFAAAIPYYLLFTYSTILGVVTSSLGADGSKYNANFGKRHKFAVVTAQNDVEGFNALLMWLACYQHQYNLSCGDVPIRQGNISFRVPTIGTPWKIMTSYGEVWMEAIGNCNQTLAGFCFYTYRRYWWRFLWYFYYDTEAENRLEYIIKEIYMTCGLVSPYQHATQPNIVNTEDRCKPKIPDNFEIAGIFDNMKKFAEQRGYDHVGAKELTKAAQGYLAEKYPIVADKLAEAKKED